MNENNNQAMEQSTAAVKTHPAGRTLLLLAVVTAFVAGGFAGYLIAREKPPAGKILSGDGYLVGVGDSPSTGPDGALMTIVEFNDMTCGDCNQVDRVLRQMVDIFPGEVRVVWKNSFRKAGSEEAMLAAQAGVAANYAGKFWDLKDKVAAMEGAVSAEKIMDFMGELGLDGEKIKDELARNTYQRRVGIDTGTAQKLGITETPTVFVNGKLLLGPVTQEKVKQAIELQLPEAKALLAAGTDPLKLYWEIIKSGKSSMQSSAAAAINPLSPGAPPPTKAP